MKMFSDLLSLEKERTKNQAVGFYLACVFVYVVLLTLNFVLMTTVGIQMPSPLADTIVTLFTLLVPTALSFGIVYKKKLGYGLKSMWFILGTAVLSQGAGFLELLLSAYLSTLKKNEVVS